MRPAQWGHTGSHFQKKRKKRDFNKILKQSRLMSCNLYIYDKTLDYLPKEILFAKTALKSVEISTKMLSRKNNVELFTVELF